MNAAHRLVAVVVVLFSLFGSRVARAQGDDDIVETLDDTPTKPTNPTEPKKPEAEPPKPDKFEFRGFTRVTAGASIAPRAVAPADGTPTNRVGYDRAFLDQHGYVDLRYSRGSSFQAVVSGSLAYATYLTEGRPGPVEPDRHLESGRLEPVLREAYVGFYSRRFDLRLGQQRIVWGNSDASTPNDVLNARDLRDRMQLDNEMIQQPTLAARADLDLGVAVLGLVFQPFFTPDKFSLFGSSWSLVQGDAPSTYRHLFGLYAAGKDRIVIDDISSSLSSSHAPTSIGESASVGSSLKFHFGSVDASFYYQYGFDRTPFLYLDPILAARLDASDSNVVNGALLDILLKQSQDASAAYGGPLVVSYVRRHHVGADAQTTTGPFVLHLDGAYDSASVFYTRDQFNSVVKPSAQIVAGAEYQTGDLNKIILMELSYMRVLGPATPLVPVVDQRNFGPLLFFEDDNVGLSNLIRWSFFEDTIVETRTFLGLEPLWFTVRGEIGYNTPDLTIRLGAMVLGGKANTYGDYFRRNESLYVTTRFSF